MEDTCDIIRLQCLDQMIASGLVSQYEIVQMAIMNTVLRNTWPAGDPGHLQWLKRLMVAFPHRAALRIELLRVFQLSEQDRCHKFTRQKRGSAFYPSILVDLTGLEGAAVCPFFPHDVSAVD